MITDRKKDLIVNDKGDNVAPQKVEGMLTLQPEIAQAMVSGDKRPYMVAPDRARCRMDRRLGQGQRRDAATSPRSQQLPAYRGGDPRGDRPGQRAICR